MEEREPELNLAHTVLHVSHSLHSQTRCDLKPGSKSLQQGGQRGFWGEWGRSEKIEVELKVIILRFSWNQTPFLTYLWVAFFQQ